MTPSPPALTLAVATSTILQVEKPVETIEAKENAITPKLIKPFFLFLENLFNCFTPLFYGEIITPNRKMSKFLKLRN